VDAQYDLIAGMFLAFSDDGIFYVNGISVWPGHVISAVTILC
jgi:hypothetical protein